MTFRANRITAVLIILVVMAGAVQLGRSGELAALSGVPRVATPHLTVPPRFADRDPRLWESMFGFDVAFIVCMTAKDESHECPKQDVGQLPEVLASADLEALANTGHESALDGKIMFRPSEVEWLRQAESLEAEARRVVMELLESDAQGLRPTPADSRRMIGMKTLLLRHSVEERNSWRRAVEAASEAPSRWEPTEAELEEIMKMPLCGGHAPPVHARNTTSDAQVAAGTVRKGGCSGGAG